MSWPTHARGHFSKPCNAHVLVRFELYGAVIEEVGVGAPFLPPAESWEELRRPDRSNHFENCSAETWRGVDQKAEERLDGELHSGRTAMRLLPSWRAVLPIRPLPGLCPCIPGQPWAQQLPSR